ncbi:structural constituent of ribosome [Arabidopsis lyrata subsp. lyrata]|uniref:Structural constituent of ribosome n=1 Tax=Arabidopsis lyrata subsp. lyrata TaxID=81972 RepID=D7L1Q2_ARALL|nr:structural constituent of ribosome [Arabidopsis lyrata subsp. lyrata]
MALMVLRRKCIRMPDITSVFRPARNCFSSRFSNSESGKDTVAGLSGCGIETVDDDAWHVSSSLSQAWRQFQADTAKNSPVTIQGVRETMLDDEDPDHDEIDNMRIRGDLFYKLDRGSKEFEEYNYDFHRKNQHKNVKREQNQEEETTMKKNNKKEVREEYKKRNDSFTGETDHPNAAVRKRERTFTFNQLTAPFHYPFCLDIYISKESVRACVIHRVTSKVVTVAHSISKDMKFDLGSTRNAAACAAVGAVLAQRCLEDDIHDVIYTPRKGDKIEGKLQVVLQALIDNGVYVKVKLKQRKLKKKTSHLMMA